MFKKYYLYFLVFALALSGCSAFTAFQAEEGSKEKKEKKPGIEDFKAATEVEGMLREGPGDFCWGPV